MYTNYRLLVIKLIQVAITGGLFLYMETNIFGLSNLGVGSNVVPNQEQDRTYELFKGETIGGVGKLINTIKPTGKWQPFGGLANKMEAYGGQLVKPAYAADKSALENALIKGGYNPVDAKNAANGPDADRLAKEYLKVLVPDNGSNNNPVPTTYKGDGTYLTPVEAQRLDDNALEEAARLNEQAAKDEINRRYDEVYQTLEDQYGEAGRNESIALGDLNAQLEKSRYTVGKQKTETGTQRDDAIAQAGNIARETQRTNRNVLRALGILGSTYAAEALQKPTNQFDTERARLVGVANQRLSELDDALRQIEDEANRQVNNVKSQYQTIKDNIRRDQRFSERERSGALVSAKAAAQQRIAEIQDYKSKYADQIKQTAQNFAAQFATILKQQQPTARLSDIMAQSMAFANQFYGNPQQVAISNNTADRKKLSAY